jgi:hypothetical protein
MGLWTRAQWLDVRHLDLALVRLEPSEGHQGQSPLAPGRVAQLEAGDSQSPRQGWLRSSVELAPRHRERRDGHVVDEDWRYPSRHVTVHAVVELVEEALVAAPRGVSYHSVYVWFYGRSYTVSCQVGSPEGTVGSEAPGGARIRQIANLVEPGRTVH